MYKACGFWFKTKFEIFDLLQLDDLKKNSLVRGCNLDVFLRAFFIGASPYQIGKAVNDLRAGKPIQLVYSVESIRETYNTILNDFRFVAESNGISLEQAIEWDNICSWKDHQNDRPKASFEELPKEPSTTVETKAAQDDKSLNETKVDEVVTASTKTAVSTLVAIADNETKEPTDSPVQEVKEVEKTVEKKTMPDKIKVATVETKTAVPTPVDDKKVSVKEFCTEYLAQLLQDKGVPVEDKQMLNTLFSIATFVNCNFK